ncbi:MAG: hypothetical protein NVS9B1_08360 [Candidatus Dormibacteraceae bacterium]
MQPAPGRLTHRASMPDHDAPAEIRGPRPDSPAPSGEQATTVPEVVEGSPSRLVKRTVTKPDGRYLILYDRRPR